MGIGQAKDRRVARPLDRVLDCAESQAEPLLGAEAGVPLEEPRLFQLAVGAVEALVGELQQPAGVRARRRGSSRRGARAPSRPRSPPPGRGSGRLPAPPGVGWRRIQSQARIIVGTGRAVIGSPASQRRRSSATASAEWVTAGRLLLQTLHADQLQGRRHTPVHARRRLGSLSLKPGHRLVERPLPRTAPGRSRGHRGSHPGRRRRSRW